MRYSSLWIASCVLFLSVLVFAQIAPNPGHRGEQINVIDPTGAPTNPNTSLQIALNNLFDAIGGGGTSYWIQTPDRNLYYNAGNVGIGTASPVAKLHLVDENNAGWRYEQYNNGDGTNFRNYRARGSIAIPLPVSANDRLAAFLAGGYHSGGTFSSPMAGMNIVAAENFTPTTQGTYLTFVTSPIRTTNSQQERMRITPDGNVGIGTTEPNNLLQVTGLINFDDTLFGTFLGYKAGISNTTGSRNSAVGYNALRFNTTGTNNSAVGMSTLYSNTTGSSNIAVGNNALFSNTTGYGNNAVGRSALYSNTTGYSNNAVGNSALNINTTGYKNSAVGNEALYSTTGNSNIAMGYRAGYGLTTGSNNILMGYGAGGNLTTGGNNIVIGYDIDAPLPTSANTLNIGNLIFATGVDGIGSTLSTGNVGIGIADPGSKLHVTGITQITDGVAAADTSEYGTFGVTRPASSNTLSYIAMTRAGNAIKAMGIDSSNRWVFGLPTSGTQIISTPQMVIDSAGNVGIGAMIPGQKLDIIGGNGRVQSGYSWLTNSDIRLKKDVTTLSGALDRISRLRGVRFNLNNTNESGFGKHVGFIAQELENEYPELVVTGEDGVKSVAYDKLTAPLVEAVKEQQAQIEKLQKIVCADHPLAEGCEQQ